MDKRPHLPKELDPKNRRSFFVNRFDNYSDSGIFRHLDSCGVHDFRMCCLFKCSFWKEIKRNACLIIVEWIKSGEDLDGYYYS